MAQTVIGIFEQMDQAQEAKSYLLANGFSGENVDINSRGTAVYGNAAKTEKEEDFVDRISNFFSNLFDDKEEASSHTEAAKIGSTLTVHARSEEEARQAAQILDNFGAVDVNEFAEKSANLSRPVGKTTTDTPATGAIPVIKEDLQVGKREVETGGMRLRSRIVERPVEENIRLREEHVNIERKPVDRPATEADFNAFKEGTVEATEHAERPVVAKEARIVEEVRLGKEVSEKEEIINDTVRHTEVDSEEIPRTEKNIR